MLESINLKKLTASTIVKIGGKGAMLIERNINSVPIIYPLYLDYPEGTTEEDFRIDYWKEVNRANSNKELPEFFIFSYLNGQGNFENLHVSKELHYRLINLIEQESDYKLSAELINKETEVKLKNSKLTVSFLLALLTILAVVTLFRTLAEQITNN